jgi:hypothetical protein
MRRPVAAFDEEGKVDAARETSRRIVCKTPDGRGERTADHSPSCKDLARGVLHSPTIYRDFSRFKRIGKECIMTACLRRRMTVGVLAGLAVVPQAHASYEGLQVQLQTTLNLQGQLRDVYRVYAAFSHPGDRLLSVGGGTDYGPMHVQSLDFTGAFPGGEFYNPNGDPNVTFDTAGAIGSFLVNYDLPGGSDSFINGMEYFVSVGGWVAPDFDQGLAGSGIGLPGGLWGVLAMQLTVDSGHHVRGTVVIGAVLDTPLAGETGLVFGNQTFTSFPAPSSLALLGLSGLCGPRRRRLS